MSKKKRFHNIQRSKSQAMKAYSFFHAHNPNGSVRGLPRLNALKAAKSQAPGILDKKTPAGAANTDEGKVEKGLESSDSASIVH